MDGNSDRPALSPGSIQGLHFTGQGQVIGYCGVAVVPGDVIVADGDGVVVVPRAVAAEVASISVSKPSASPTSSRNLRTAARCTASPGEELEAEHQAWKESRG